MNANNIKSKYNGLQSKFLKSSDVMDCLGRYGCLFFSLCSIAEEYNESHHNRFRVDIVADFIVCRSKGWIGSNSYIKDSVAILNYLTGAKWSREIKNILNTVPDNMYTVEHWHNDKTGFDHFRRRWGDTLEYSNTVKNGKLINYYCYIVKEN